jgi:hypothetical protein
MVHHATRRLAATAAWALAVFGCLGATPGQAGPFLTDTTRVSQGTATDVAIRGVPGESFRIAYTDAAGVARTKTVTLTNLLAQHTTVPAKAGTGITITNLTQPAEPAQNYIAQRLTPGADTAVTALAMNAGSTLTAFGQTFALGGSFTTVATNADYDTASPGYGTLSGTIPSSFFDVFAEIAPNRIDFLLDGSGPQFQLDVAPTWDATLPDTGIAVPFTQALSGSLSFMGSTMPFTGQIAGSVTFHSSNFETIAGQITLDNIGSGVFSASGRTVIPEPATLILMASAIGLMGAMVGWRRG